MREKIDNKLSNYGSDTVVKIDPELIEAYAKIGMLYAELKSWPESIAYYQRSIALSPNSVENYRKLALVWLQLGKKQDAIASLEKAIALELELEDSEDLDHKPEVWAKAGDNLANAERWDEAIVHYQRAIEIEPNYHQSYQKLGIALAKVGNIEDAIASYRQAVELALESGHDHYLLGLSLARIGQEEDAIATFRRAGELLEQQGQIELAIDAYQEILKLASNGDISFKLGMLHAQCGQFPEALTQYQQALQSQSGNPENYAKLAVILVQQGLGKQVINCYNTVFQNKPESAKYYHNLGIVLSQECLIDTAVDCFRAVPQIKKPVEEVYDYIWRGLNELGTLDEDYISNNISGEEAILGKTEYHFATGTKYKFIHISTLNEEDEDFLAEIGVSLDNLRLIQHEGDGFGRSSSLEIALEETFVNFFCGTTHTRIAEVAKDVYPFQRSIVETGYIYTVDPFSGRLLRSNQSFYLATNADQPIVVYRFVGTEVFYLITGLYIGIKLFLYFPLRELIIAIQPLWMKAFVEFGDYAQIINKFKSYAVGSWQQFQEYILFPYKKSTASIWGVLNHLYHPFFNMLQSYQDLYEHQNLAKLESVVVGYHNLLKIENIFPELASCPIYDASSDYELFNLILEKKLMVLMLSISRFWLSQKLADRMNKAALKDCSIPFLEMVNNTRQHFPLVLIQVRNNTRVCLSQAQVIADVINNLHANYPDMGVIVDGWSRQEKYVAADESAIEKDLQTLKEITSLVEKSVSLYNAIGFKISEKIVWSQAIDFYIAPFSSGIAIFSGVANKKGVVHASQSAFKTEIPNQSARREQGINPSMVVGIEDDMNNPGWHSNYYCDWRDIYQECLKIIDST